MKIFGLEIKRTGQIMTATNSKNNAHFFREDSVDIIRNFWTYTQMYRQSVEVFRCVEELQQNSCKNGFSITNDKGDIIVVDEFTKAISKQTAKIKGKKVKGWRVLKNNIIQNLNVTGNVYIEVIKSPLGNVNGFQTLDPRTMSIVATRTGEILRYIQTVNGVQQSFDPDDIIHYFTSQDPDNQMFGMSKLEPLVYDVFGDIEANTSNYAFFKNSGVPSGVYIIDDEFTDDDEKNLAIKNLEKQLKGGKNKHKVIYSNVIKDVKVTQQNHKDMDFIVGRKFAINKICSALGVPPFMIGYTEGVNLSNGEGQDKNFIENTIIPLEDNLEEIYQEMLDYFDPSLIITFIHQETADRTKKIDNANKLVDNGIINRTEARVELDLPVAEEDEEIMDTFTVKQGTIRLEDAIIGEFDDPEGTLT
jgi:HK97 family phage portal protein